MRILLVSSVGGHLTELMQLRSVLDGHHVALVVNDEAALPDFPFGAVYRIAHAERDWRVLLNMAEAARILQAEQPDIVLSMGAGPAVPFAVVARALTGAKIIFVESAAAVRRPTMTGRLIYPLAHRFFFQWPALKRVFRKGELAQVLFG